MELKEIPETFGYYATCDGDIYSRRHRNGSPGLKEIPFKLKACGKKDEPYKRVTIIYKGVRQCVCVHILVWTAFNGPIDAGLTVDHIDFNGANNNITNLRLLSRADNRMHSVKALRQAVGERIATSKISDADALEIIKARRNGVKVKELSKKYGVSKHTITYTVKHRKSVACFNNKVIA